LNPDYPYEDDLAKYGIDPSQVRKITTKPLAAK
jgi:hypothetical protein